MMVEQFDFRRLFGVVAVIGRWLFVLKPLVPAAHRQQKLSVLPVNLLPDTIRCSG